MNTTLTTFPFWIACSSCQGIGTKSRGLSKKARQNYQIALDYYLENSSQGSAPILPKGTRYTCTTCLGSGLIQSDTPPTLQKEKYPHIAIIGAGIGGIALAVACLHRGIPFTIFERDANFEARAQGYGLTLQQASKALKSFGIQTLTEGVTSTKHLVHTTDGKVVGEWGMRKWLPTQKQSGSKQANIHIARQAFRLALLEQLGGINQIKWGHQLVNIETGEENEIRFNVNGNVLNYKADLVVGADGIRSTVRKLLIGEATAPLRYLGCIVILGICKLNALENISSPLLDSETVFQTANGNERIYVMPFNTEAIMWQLSFPISEESAILLSKKGAKALKEEACKRTAWHSPIPQIIAATPETEISGYPVYDRALLTSNWLEKMESATLIGDAAHPMSPFKGQGANQALLDALSLARSIHKGCNSDDLCKNLEIRKSVLSEFEREMLERSAIKVKDSEAAVEVLHSEKALEVTNAPRRK